LILSLVSCRVYKPVAERGLSSITGAPVFMVPACDSANCIERVYFNETTMKEEEVMEVTVVFRDEDQPYIVWDVLYDAFRKVKYHRKNDIETFYLRRDSHSHSLLLIDFGDASGRDQSFYTPWVRHFHDLIPVSRVLMVDGRPVIYVNTWNHLFSEKDTNVALPKTIYRTYASYSGSRKDAEPQKH
jgi:uncharacterized protein (UPF0248 family)